jgi:hypothetical protein
MRPGAAGLQRIDRPIPAVGGFQDHLRILAVTSHHTVETVEIVEALDGLQDLPGIGGSDHHTSPPMQIDTHELPARVL